MNDNRKYKILLVHNFYQQPGGEDTVFRNEKKLLEDNGHEVITYTRDNSELKGNILKKLLLPFITIFNPKTYFDIKKIIKDKNIDIVHVHNTLCLISPAVFYAAFKMKTPVIQTLHNFRMQCANGLFYRDGHICEDCVNDGLLCALKHKCYRNSFFQTLAVAFMLKIHRLTGIYRKINFICLTEFNKNKLLLLNKDKKIIDEIKIFIKPNFVFDSSSSKNKDNKQSQSHNVDYYLYVGRLEYIKGIDIVFEAFSKMPDKIIHIVGKGNEKYEDSYSKYANIKLYGQLSRSEVEKEMASAKALIFASRLYEGLPMSIIEAYMNALPVITSNIGNANEMVKDGITGLHFISGDVNSLISVIDKFNSLNIEVIKKNVRTEYDDNYNEINGYDNLINKYDTVYNYHEKLNS